MFSIVVVPIYIPTNSEGMLFSTPCTEFICWVVNDCHSDQCWYFLSVVLICISLIIRMLSIYFMFLLAIHISVIENCLSLLPIFWLVWFFLLSSCMCFLVSWAVLKGTALLCLQKLSLKKTSAPLPKSWGIPGKLSQDNFFSSSHGTSSVKRRTLGQG